MKLDYILNEELRIRENVTREYVDTTNRSWPIYDGIVNPERYVSSSPRILWILKEPYDDGDDYKGGGWSLTEDCMNKNTDMTSRKRPFQPICYIDYGIRRFIYDWNTMPWLRDCEELRDGLRNIGFINISKLPGIKWSPWTRIVGAYKKFHRLIFDQIRTYAPNIIFVCDPHANLILQELGFTSSQWIWFESAASVQISSDQRLVWVAHPSQRANSRKSYVNDAIKAATSSLNWLSATGLPRPHEGSSPEK